jgi:polyhydroxyalkanoate synthesis regulator phasin
MQTEKFAKEMIDLQKTTFNNTFDAMAMVQDHAEKLVETALDQITWLPEEGRNVIDEWIAVCKKGRTDFKGMVDDGFVKLTDIFTDTPTVKSQVAQPAKTK